MLKWIRRAVTRTKNFDLLESVWYANLDNLVGITQYLQDDSDQRKQRSEPCEPISPLNPNSVINQVTTAPIIQPEPVIVQDTTALTTTETPTTSVATVTSSQATTEKQSTTTTSGTDKKDDPKGIDIPKGKALVPGFGIVLSMQLLNSGYNMQQQQIQESIKLIQEQDYERQQNLLIDFIVSNDSRDYLIRASANRWRSILRDNPLQRFDRDD
jgi:hypothetical protein